MAYRNELKYLINHADFTLLRLRFASFMQRDKHVDADGDYTVRSLYFDDYYNSAYNEKYMGVLSRQKFRIRTYSQTKDVINLERKIKWGNYVNKESAKLTVDDVENIMIGNVGGLIKASNPLLPIFYYEYQSNVLRPRVIIEYEREPFILDAGNVRITFDQNVRAGVGTMDIFDEHIPMISVLQPGMVIMEVKYTDFLPSMIRNLLAPEASDFLALSKYIMGCDLTILNRHSND